MKRIVLSLLSLFVISACESKTPLKFQNPEARAKAFVGDSFGIQNAPATAETPANVDRAKITIQKSALEKEFLLQTSLLQQQMLPGFSGMQSRIVFFRQIEKKIYMIEASKGLLLPKDYPQTLPLAEFEVVDETTATITFDFNRGMSRLFVAGDWRARDVGQTANYRSIPVAFSYISQARLTTNNQIEIRQIALLNVPSNNSMTNVPVEVAYYLTPYAPNPGFVPTIAPDDLDRMGFFEVASQFNEDGGPTSFAAKMDINKPIVYAISANTPSDYKDAVREGILYWNKAFGREVVKVVDAPAGITAPNPDYNIVQWAEVDMAGFAYADAQMDPRTGEVLHQQIYFSSGWRRAARGEMLEYVKSGRVMHSNKSRIALAGFQPNALCDMDINAAVANELGKISMTVSDAAKVQKASADLLREVVAHEVGHTLGLRHNFAGSLAANYAVDQRETLFKNYLETGSAPADLVTASTVMDYQFPIEGAMHGDQLLKSSKASSYDEKAIRSLYFGDKFTPSELPLFCTDSQIDVYSDCAPYDVGASYVAWIKYTSHHQLDNLPYSILKAYVSAKAPSFGGQTRDIASVAVDPRLSALISVYHSADLIDILHKDGRLLSVERKYPYANSVNADEIRRETVDLLLADFTRNGQFEEILVPTSVALIDRLAQKYEALLNEPKMIRGTTVEGKTYEFSAEEIKIMKNYGRIFFGRLRSELARIEVQILNGDSVMVELLKEMYGQAIALVETPRLPYDMNDLSLSFAAYVEKRAEEILLSTTGEPLTFKRNVVSDWTLPPGSKSQTPGPATPEVTTLTLPNFTYGLSLRKQAAGMLRSDRAESPAWGYAERIALGNAFEKVVTTALPGVTVKDGGTIENYPREVTKFILETREIRGAINKP